MSVYINSIKPINWFNYKGEENLIKFSKGINVMVGNNNAGKTKLHNAFRYILDGTVILKVKDGSETINKVEQINTVENLREIINYSAFSQLKLNENLKVGVELIFTKQRKDDDKKYLLRKIFKIRKLTDKEFEIVNKEKIVLLIDKYTDSPRQVNDDFDDIVNTLLPRRYKKFFLIEGEQIGMMTPLFGDGLKSTIKGLTNISDIDQLVDLVDDLQKRVIKEKRTQENSSKSFSEEQRKRNQLKNDLESQNQEWETVKNKFEADKDSIEGQIKKLETNVNESQTRKKLLENLNKLDSNVKVFEEQLNSIDRNFLDSLTNHDDFTISKLDEFNEIESSFNHLDKSFGGYMLDRRNELNTEISEEDHLLVGELNQSQPHPVILEKMLNHQPKPKCYVCKSDLKAENENFIKNVLIPHFRNDKEEQDELIDNLNLLKDSFKKIYQFSRNYSINDEKWIENYYTLKGEIIGNKKVAEKKLREFIQDNGDRDDLDKGDELFILNYGEMKESKGKLEVNIEQLKTDIKYNNTKIKSIKIEDIDENNLDPKLESLKELNSFINDIDDVLDEIKSDVYYGFGEKLEKKSSHRFTQLMRNNMTVKGQELKVNIEKKSSGTKNEFNFEVFLKDKFGNRLKQTGGASSTCEPLAVVFALIDISESRVSYPFIADAPVSKFTNDTKYSFFETLVDEEIFEQSIIISMDCWDNISEDINELGRNIKNLISNQKGSSFILMKPKLYNAGVELNYIIDGT